MFFRRDCLKMCTVIPIFRQCHTHRAMLLVWLKVTSFHNKTIHTCMQKILPHCCKMLAVYRPLSTFPISSLDPTWVINFPFLARHWSGSSFSISLSSSSYLVTQNGFLHPLSFLPPQNAVNLGWADARRSHPV